MAPALLLADTDNILSGGAVSGTAPVTGYTLADVISRDPARRVLYGATSATVTVTIASKTGAVAILPVSNLDPTVATLTNGAGLSVAFPIPALPPNRIPLTAILDFSASSNRTSTVWNLVIASNSANVLLGGGFAIYSTKTALARNYRYGWREREQHRFIEHENDYGVRLRYDLRTMTRSFQYEVPATDPGFLDLRTWYRANHTNPGVFWPDPSVNDAYLGTWDLFEVERKVQAANLNRITVPFDELCKGLPV